MGIYWHVFTKMLASIDNLLIKALMIVHMFSFNLKANSLLMHIIFIF